MAGKDTDVAKRIRNRRSYKYWKGFAKILNNCKNTRERLLAVYRTLDSMKAFGSMTHADWSKQSLEQVIKDEGLNGNSKG